MAEILISNEYDTITFDSDVYSPSRDFYRDHTVSSKKTLKLGEITASLRQEVYTKIDNSESTFNYQNGTISKENLIEAVRAQVNFKRYRKVFDYDITSFELIESIVNSSQKIIFSDASVLRNFIQYGFPQIEDDYEYLNFIWEQRYKQDFALMMGFLAVIMSRYNQLLPFSMSSETLKLMQQQDTVGVKEPYKKLPFHTTPRDLIKRIVENSVDDKEFAKLPAAWQIEMLTDDDVFSVDDVASVETLDNKVRQC